MDKKKKIVLIIALVVVAALVYFFIIKPGQATSATTSTTGVMSASDANTLLLNAAKSEPNPVVSNRMITYISGLSDANKITLAVVYSAIVNGTSDILTPDQKTFYQNVINANSGFHW